MAQSSTHSHSRSALIDCTKGLACAAIVWHHLAFYGPMSDVAHPVMPNLLDWLYEYARMAVQIFLVIGGFLAAASLAPQGLARFDSPWSKIGKRFVRLVVPYAVALVVTIVISAAIRPWFDHESVSADPDLWQLFAHALLLQNIVGEESLSAGVWYVSIDFQLFAGTVLLLGAVRWLKQVVAGRLGVQAVQRWWPWAVTGMQMLVVLGTAASLFSFNLDSDLDIWAIYFMGAYGLGMMAYWAVAAEKRSTAWSWAMLIAALVIGALVFEWRDRIFLAGATALLLIVCMRTEGVARWKGFAPLRRLGEISYSVFLIHFSICLLVNAVVNHFWHGSVTAAVVGIPFAFVLSLTAGYALYQLVERHVSSWSQALRWQAGLIGAGLLTTMIAGLR
ncbi:acyltransferase family protein [Comamonas resistens]|uniref:Acyltransferase n=1 Tax=Comamonas resistens TaxID=3046670 RepID=A0ABY8SML7_9BURK|nr:acyltransferase [Comamonas resistens]MDL5038797.1 acyltransferase [Comamonas resistens]WHS64148.1 acyltransferase [Comamonas resistens]